jgi:S-formylglutathione hydrolase FrmB
MLFMRAPSLLAIAVLAMSCSSAIMSQSGVGTGNADAQAGSVHEATFLSQALGVRKQVAVYLPPSYGRDATRRFPVAYYLHGLSGSETDWLSRAAIDVIADSLAAAGLPEMIIVLPDGDDGWYTNWVDPVPYRSCADTTRTESPNRYCVQRANYEDYIARDVVSFIDSRYRTMADRAHRGIGGLSMGGYGAMILALRNPTVFAAAASHSGVVSPMYSGGKTFAAPARYATNVDELRTAGATFWSRYVRYFGTDLDRWRTADPARAAERVKQAGGPMPALFIDCGREDGFLDQNRAFDWELTRLGVTHRYAEWPGGHTWRYWTTHVPESLSWMAREIAGAKAR